MLQTSKVRVRLLVILQRRVLVLADLLHRGDLAQKSLGIEGHKETGSGIEASVLELGKSDLADLQLQPADLFGLGLDVSLLQPQSRPALLGLLLDICVLLVDASSIGLQLLDQASCLCHRQRRVRRGRQAGWKDAPHAQCHPGERKHRDAEAPTDRWGAANLESARGHARSDIHSSPTPVSPSPAHSSLAGATSDLPDLSSWRTVTDMPTERCMTVASAGA